MTRKFGRTAMISTSMVAVSLVLGGCQYDGLNSIPMPGTQGQGDDAYTLKIEMPNVTTLSQNSPVRVDDVAVGVVSDIEVQGWHALVTVRVNGDVALPANATARIGQTSLLGSQHLELSVPTGVEPEGRLSDGDVIPIERAGAYPTIEQTLSSLSVVLNGGGLAQIQDIVKELNATLDGREDSVRDLLPRVDELVSGLDKQREDIISAMDGLDRLSIKVNEQTPTIEAALNEIPAGLEVLVGQRQNLTSALTELGKLSETATHLIESSGEDLKANLRNLTPTLRELANSGSALTQVLSIALTYPFPMKTMDSAIRGDYANLMMTIDMSGERIDSNFFTGTGIGGSLGGVEGAVGALAGVAGQAGDPLKDPVTAPAAAPAPAFPGLPSIPGLSIPGLPPIGVPAP